MYFKNFFLALLWLYSHNMIFCHPTLFSCYYDSNLILWLYFWIIMTFSLNYCSSTLTLWLTLFSQYDFLSSHFILILLWLCFHIITTFFSHGYDFVLLNTTFCQATLFSCYRDFFSRIPTPFFCFYDDFVLAFFYLNVVRLYPQNGIVLFM